jgi:hypothetical protein
VHGNPIEAIRAPDGDRVLWRFFRAGMVELWDLGWSRRAEPLKRRVADLFDRKSGVPMTMRCWVPGTPATAA